MAAVRHHLWGARGGELGGHGLFHNHPVYDAGVRGAIDSLLPLAHEQGTGLHHVSAVFCLCRRLADVRIRLDQLPSVRGKGKDKMPGSYRGHPGCPNDASAEDPGGQRMPQRIRSPPLP